MKGIGLVLALCALVTGLTAAWYWYKASVVPNVPKVDRRFGGGMSEAGTPWLAGTVDAIKEASDFNAKAALWTAASVVLSALSSFVGYLI